LVAPLRPEKKGQKQQQQKQQQQQQQEQQRLPDALTTSLEYELIDLPLLFLSCFHFALFVGLFICVSVYFESFLSFLLLFVIPLI
jgi:hypothetical protein